MDKYVKVRGPALGLLSFRDEHDLKARCLQKLKNVNGKKYNAR